MAEPEWRIYAHEEQRRIKADGLKIMVQGEAYREDDDGICRQPMKWLKSTNLKAAPIVEIWVPKAGALDPAISKALEAIGYRFPLQSGDYVHSCCEGAWLEKGDVATEELFCCDEQDTTVYRLVADPLVAPSTEAPWWTSPRGMAGPGIGNDVHDSLERM